MTRRSTGFDRGTPGAAVLTSDPGDPWALTEVALTGGGSATYSSVRAAHGAVSVLLSNPTTADKVTIGFIGPWSASTLTLSMCLYWAAYPSGPMDLATIRNSTGNASKLQIWADGKLRVVNAAGTVLKTFAAAVGTGAWRRYELSVTIGTTTSNGRIQFAYYDKDSGSAIDSYDSGATTNAGTTGLVTAHFGMMTSGVTGQVWADSVQVEDVAAPLGPWSTAVALTVADVSQTTDSGFAVALFDDLGVTVEADTARPVGRVKSRALGVAAETETAQPVGRVRSRVLGVAAEADTALPVGRRKSRGLGVATQTGTAQPVGRVKSRGLGVAAELDSPGDAFRRRPPYSIARAAEADTAQPVGRRKSRALGVAAETETALPVTLKRSNAAAAALELDEARPVGRGKARALTLAAEVDTALPLGRYRSRSLGRAFESEEARPLVAVRGTARARGKVTRRTTTSPTVGAARVGSARVKGATA